ncbi:hypothetical protein ACRAWG_39360 (plasmid) [Methylobacterium sp. P31]
MPAVTLVAAAEAAAFTLGCAIIHAQRHHAERLTNILAVATIVTLLAAAFLTVPLELLNTAVVAIEAADLGGSTFLQSE